MPSLKEIQARQKAAEAKSKAALTALRGLIKLKQLQKTKTKRRRKTRIRTHKISPPAKPPTPSKEEVKELVEKKLGPLKPPIPEKPVEEKPAEKKEIVIPKPVFEHLPKPIKERIKEKTYILEPSKHKPQPTLTTGLSLEHQRMQNIVELAKQISKIESTAKYKLPSGKIISGSELKETELSKLHSLLSQPSVPPTQVYLKEGKTYYQLPPESQYLLTHTTLPRHKAITHIKTGKIGKLYESLTPEGKTEYGIKFHPFTSEPVETWKYYPGGVEYIRSHPEIVEQYIKEKGGYQKFFESLSWGQKNELLTLMEAEGIPSGIPRNYWQKVKWREVVKKYARDLLTKTSEQRKEEYFSRLPMWQRAMRSAGYSTISTLAFPVTITEWSVRTVTGRETPVLTPVSRTLYEIQPGGPSGLISTATEEVVSHVTGQPSTAWKRFTKYPVSGIFATAGELVGMKTLGVAGKYASKPFTATSKYILRKLPGMYTRFTEKFGRVPILEKIGGTEAIRTAMKWSKGYKPGRRLISRGARILKRVKTPRSSLVIKERVAGGRSFTERVWLSPSEYRVAVERFKKLTKPSFEVAEARGEIPYSVVYEYPRLRGRKLTTKVYSYFEYPEKRVILRQVKPIKPLKIPPGMRRSYLGELLHRGEPVGSLYEIVEVEPTEFIQTGLRPSKLGAFEPMIKYGYYESPLRLRGEAFTVTFEKGGLGYVRGTGRGILEMYGSAAEKASRMWTEKYQPLKYFLMSEEATQTLVRPEVSVMKPSTRFVKTMAYERFLGTEPIIPEKPLVPVYVLPTITAPSISRLLAREPATITFREVGVSPATRISPVRAVKPFIVQRFEAKPEVSKTTARKTGYTERINTSTITSTMPVLAQIPVSTQRQIQQQEQTTEQVTRQLQQPMQPYIPEPFTPYTEVYRPSIVGIPRLPRIHIPLTEEERKPVSKRVKSRRKRVTGYVERRFEIPILTLR